MRPSDEYRGGELPGLAAVCHSGCNTDGHAQAGVRFNRSRAISQAANIDLSVPGDTARLLDLFDFFFNRI